MDDATATELTNKLTEHLKEILSDNKVKATVLLGCIYLYIFIYICQIILLIKFISVANSMALSVSLKF